MGERLPLCPLCGVNEADDTGSHVVPYFLIKSMVSLDPDNKRSGQDMIFKLSDHGTDFYVRGGTEEDFVKTFGKDVDDVDLSDNRDLFTVDNKWCKSCEAMFATLESLAAMEYSQILANGTRVHTMPNSEVFRLFIYSVLWRLSVTSFLPNSISKEFETKLHNYLIDCLDADPKELKRKCLEKKDELCQYPLLVGRTFEEESSRNEVYAYDNSEPKTFIFNDLIINISESSQFDLNGVKPPYTEEDTEFLNKDEDQLKVILYSQEEYELLKKESVQRYVLNETRRLKVQLVNLFVKFVGRPPSEVEAQSFLDMYFEKKGEHPDLRNEIFIKTFMQFVQG